MADEIEGVPDPDKWVEEFGDYLFGMAISQVDRPEVAEDLVQETFLRAYKGYHSFRSDSKFRTWLRGILSNVINDFYRNQYREKKVFENPSSDTVQSDAPDLDREQPDNLAERMEIWKALEFCLTQIPNQSADIFRAAEMEGQSNKDIAAHRGISENGVAVLLYRARKALKECMLNLFKNGNVE